MAKGAAAGLVAGALVEDWSKKSPENGSSEKPLQNGGNYDPEAVAAEHITKLNRRIEELESRCKRFFDIIASIENERNRWQKMFHDEASGHLKAQYVYEQSLITERGMLAEAVEIINKYRKKNNEPPMERPFNELHGYPVGEHNAYLALMDKMNHEAPSSFDYVKHSIELIDTWKQIDDKKQL